MSTHIDRPTPGHGIDPHVEGHGADPHAPGHHGARSEEDRISTGAIIGVGVASLVVFLIASIVTSVYFQRRLDAHGPIAIPPEVGDSKIGMVEQQLFNGGPLRGERDRARRLERLASYGWVEPNAGVVHLPIQEAMDLVVKGVRPQGAPGPGAAGTPPGGQP
jgi:hypothetical protein